MTQSATGGLALCREARRVLLEQRRHRVGGRRATEVVALRQRAAGVAEELVLRRGLDTLGDGGHPEAAGEREDGADDRRGLRVLGGGGQEGAVDLEDVDGQLAQARQRGVPGAEV